MPLMCECDTVIDHGCSISIQLLRLLKDNLVEV